MLGNRMAIQMETQNSVTHRKNTEMEHARVQLNQRLIFSKFIWLENVELHCLLTFQIWEKANLIFFNNKCATMQGKWVIMF